jgi:hypothetical protein
MIKKVKHKKRIKTIMDNPVKMKNSRNKNTTKIRMS